MNPLPGVAAIFLSIAAALLGGCGGAEPETPASSRDAASSADAPTSAAASTERSVAETVESEAAAATEPPAGSPPLQAPKAASEPSRTAAAAPAGGGAAPMPGLVTRQTELKAEPAPGAETLRSLAANTPVTVTTRQGGWLQVTSGDARGWVRLLHVSTQPAGGTSGAREELEAAARVATGRAGTGNIAVTTGIRGLDEEELRKARPDTEELDRLESLGAERADAQKHAARRGLERRQVPYPPAPQAR